MSSILSGVTRPGDVVVAAGGFYLPLRLEAERGGIAADVRALPEEAAAHPGWFVPALPGREDAERIRRTAAGLRPGGRLFLVVPPAYATPELVAALQSGGLTRVIAETRDVVVILRSPAPSSPPDSGAP